MILYSNDKDGLYEVVMTAEEFKILRGMAKRVKPINAKERDMLIDLGNEEEDEE